MVSRLQAYVQCRTAKSTCEVDSTKFDFGRPISNFVGAPWEDQVMVQQQLECEDDGAKVDRLLCSEVEVR